jgi:putative SOS response-associated peptidase YedK
MTRSWYALPDTEVMAVAGLWRLSAEWGAVYTMVMVESAPQMAEVHDRMPLILRDEDRDTWISGSPDQALGLCRTWAGDLLADHTAERWAGGGAQRTLL